MTFAYKIVEEKKLCSNIRHNPKGKVIAKYKNDNLGKITPKSISLLLKRPILIPYFHLPLIIIRLPHLQDRQIKSFPPPKIEADSELC